jgi:hypothetical protein
MPRKRAPGAGRRPKGEFTGKSETFTSRITPILRQQLDAAAHESGRSLSQEVEARLSRSLADDKPTDPPTRAFAFLVGELAYAIALGNRASWHNDRYLREAFRLALPMLLDRIPVGPGDPGREHHVSPQQLAAIMVDGLMEEVESPRQHMEEPGVRFQHVLRMKQKMRADLGIPARDAPNRWDRFVAEVRKEPRE